MSFLGVYFIGLLAILIYVTVVWLASLVANDTGVADIAWGFGFIFVALVYFAFTSGWGFRRLLILSLVIVWGLRLSIYLGWRNIGQQEDIRYARLRRRYRKDWWWVSYLQVFILQGVAMWLVSAPLLAAQFHAGPRTITLFDVFGVFLWFIGFFFEAVSDWQLARFRANPANKDRVLDRGLWRYSRHPNYFGNSVVWWSYYIIAIAAPWGFLTVFSPILMMFLLIRVSGIPLLERDLKKRPAYVAYMRRTSSFFPLPPKQPPPDRRPSRR